MEERKKLVKSILTLSNELLHLDLRIFKPCIDIFKETYESMSPPQYDLFWTTTSI